MQNSEHLPSAGGDHQPTCRIPSDVLPWDHPLWEPPREYGPEEARPWFWDLPLSDYIAARARAFWAAPWNPYVDAASFGASHDYRKAALLRWEEFQRVADPERVAGLSQTLAKNLIRRDAERAFDFAFLLCEAAKEHWLSTWQWSVTADFLFSQRFTSTATDLREWCRLLQEVFNACTDDLGGSTVHSDLEAYFTEVRRVGPADTPFGPAPPRTVGEVKDLDADGLLTLCAPLFGEPVADFKAWRRRIATLCIRKREERQPIISIKDAEQIVRRAWMLMRRLPGGSRPAEPKSVKSVHDACRYLDLAANWCDSAGRVEPGPKFAKPARQSGQPKQGSGKRGMSVEQANANAMRRAARDPTFVQLTQRVWAERIGCSTGTVAQTRLWQQTMVETGHGRKHRKPQVQSLSNQVLLRAKESTFGDPADEAAEREGARRQQILDRLTDEQNRDYEPSPLEDDLPDRPPKRVRERKRL